LISAFICGALSALAMPPIDMFWILFFTFPALVWLLDGTAADRRRGMLARFKPFFIIGWWFAFGYFLAGLWWIGSALLIDARNFAWMIPLAVLGIPALLALFWAVAIAAARLLWSDDWRRIVILAVFLALAEYLRGTILTGFPWNTIGYAAMTNPLMMQSASVLGLYGITPLAILVFASPAILAPRSDERPGHRLIFLMVCIALGAMHVGFGYWRLQNNPVQLAERVRLRVVQPAIMQKDKWLPENESNIFNSYIQLSDSKKGDITHFIWPESAFPFVLAQRRDALAAIGEMLPQDATLITGAMRVEAGAQDISKVRVFNSVFVINDKGEIIGTSDKLHLVPFGEYLPFQEFAESLGLQQLTGIDGGFAAGENRKSLATNIAGSFLPLICFEIAFPGKIRADFPTADTPGSKAVWIINVTNDAWFGKTSGPYQHHRQAVVRGVEEGLSVIRAANSGISSVSDPYGRIQGFLGLGERGSFDAGLPLPAASPTYYQNYRELGFILICAGLLLFSARRQTG
jgi:apolipoprotein N-acyltransferase